MLLRLAALLAALASPLAAQSPAPPEGVEAVGLIPGWSLADGTRIAAIEIRLAPGWHTYWRAPGSIGVPPQFDWSGSQNLAAVAYEWPAPSVIDTPGSRTIGYEGALVLPVRLTPAVAAAPLDVSVAMAFGVCRDICIPAESLMTARLERGDPPRGRSAIEAALAARPLDSAAAGVTGAACALAADGNLRRLTAEIRFDAPPDTDLVAVLEADARPDLWIGAAETKIDGRVLHASARIDATGPGGIALDRSRLRLTLIGPAHAIDIRGCPAG